jgi:hypothetical protein
VVLRALVSTNRRDYLSGGSVKKTVLLLSLSNWFGSARLPKALSAAGFEVGIWQSRQA